MAMDGVFADEKALGNRVVAEADRNETQHFELPHGQSCSLVAARSYGLRTRLRCSDPVSTAWARDKLEVCLQRASTPRSRAEPRRRPSRVARGARARARARPAHARSRKARRSSRTDRPRLPGASAPLPCRRCRPRPAPAARLADARSGSVCARAAMSRSSSSAFCGIDPVAELDLRADQQLESGGALGSVLQRKFPQIAIGQIGRRSSGRRDRTPTIARPSAAIGCAPALSKNAMASSSFPCRRRSSPRRTSPSPVIAGRHAASSSVAADSSRSASSHAPRHMHTDAYCVRHTANSGRSPHFCAEVLEPIAPLRRAIVVADAIARRNQVAAGEADQHVDRSLRPPAPTALTSSSSRSPSVTRPAVTRA